ncbi:MAG: sulfatase [Deltaproteobacteria bacterium]|nr:sulfatase [Deltaproteobacteria bacterium]
MGTVSKRKILLLAVAALLAASGIALVAVLAVMFPSADGLPWGPGLGAVPGPERPMALVLRLVERAPGMTYRGDHEGPLAQARKYAYLHGSPYLPADRVSARHVFALAAGEALASTDLSAIKDAGAYYDGRYALYLPGGTSASLAMDLPDDAVLSTAMAALPSFAGVETCGATVTVFAERHGRRRRLATVDAPHGSAAAFRWRDVELDLGPGGPATLVLETAPEPGCRGNAHVFLDDPRVYAPSHAPPPLNLLYINVCTMRADDLHASGAPRASTPAMDALVARGVLYAAARSNANWSKSSQISALTGRYPSSVGIKPGRVPVGAFERDTFERLAWPTLPAVLRAQGYETAALADNIFLSGFMRVGVDLGFGRFVDDAHHIANTAELAAEAVRFFETRRSRPFFLYVNLANAHYKYRPPREHLFRAGFGLADLFGDTQSALHRGEVAYADDAVGRMLAALDQLGLTERTLVVLQGDHGEILDPRQDLEVTVNDTHTPRKVITYSPTLYKHGWTWFEPEVRVPLAMSLPGRIPQGARVERPVSSIDTAPTVLGLMGVPVPRTMQSRGLADNGAGTPVSIVEGKQFKSVVAGSLKYVRFAPGLEAWRRRGETTWTREPEMLFDLVADPGETRSLAREPSRAADLARMRAALDRNLPRSAALHLVAFRGPKGARFEGRVELSSKVLTTTLRNADPGDRTTADGGTIMFSVTAEKGEPAVLAFTTEEEVTAATLSVSVDGRPLEGSALRLGPYGLPLAADRMTGGRVELDGRLLRRLAIAVGQDPGRAEGDGALVRWWTKRVAEGGPEPYAAEDVDADVMDAMRGWGYAK